MSLGPPSPLAENREPVRPELERSLVGTITAASISGGCNEGLGFQGSSPKACTVVGFFLVMGRWLQQARHQVGVCTHPSILHLFMSGL